MEANAAFVRLAIVPVNRFIEVKVWLYKCFVLSVLVCSVVMWSLKMVAEKELEASHHSYSSVSYRENFAVC